MSDESPPPPLRLKPRPATAPVNPPADAPAPASPAEPATPNPASTEAESSRLRLKPKLFIEDPAPEPAAATPPASTPAAPAEDAAPLIPPAPATAPEPPPEPVRPRLRPRLANEASAEPAVPPAVAPVPTAESAAPASTSPAAPESATPPATPPPATPPPAVAPEAAAEPRFKLKPKTPVANPPVATVPPSAEPPVAADVPPPIPAPEVPPSPAAAPTPAAREPVPHLNLPPRGSVDMTEEIAALAAKRPEEKPAFRVGLVAALVLIVAGVGGGGYFVYRTYFSGQPASAAAPAGSKPASSLGKEAAGVLKQAEAKAKELASVPGQLIDKAQDAVAARRGNEQERVDAAIEGRESEGKRAIEARTPEEIAERLARANNAPAASQSEVVHLDLGSSATPPSGAPTPALDIAEAHVQASSAFKAFVTNARINGVFQGNPPRALINGRTVRPGELLDSAQGIVFDRIDAGRKLVFFKDQTGAVVAKKY